MQNDYIIKQLGYMNDGKLSIGQQRRLNDLLVEVQDFAWEIGDSRAVSFFEEYLDIFTELLVEQTEEVIEKAYPDKVFQL